MEPKGWNPGKGGKKIMSIGLVSSLVLMGFLGFITFESEIASGSTTINVGYGPVNDTTSIVHAVGILANPGDTVFVHSGIYFGGIIIDKTINLTGEDRDTTIIDAQGIGFVVEFVACWVNVTGFTITNGSHGFFSQQVAYSNNRIEGNIVYNNTSDGIHLEDGSMNNRIINNTIYNNTYNGIHLAVGTNNFVIGNIIHHNGLGKNKRGGISLFYDYNNTITGNTVHDNNHGIMLRGQHALLSTEHTIAGNIIYNNEYGIRTEHAESNTFVENLIFNNNYSVYMEQGSWNNSFINCTLTNPGIEDFNLTGNSHAILLNTTFNELPHP